MHRRSVVAAGIFLLAGCVDLESAAFGEGNDADDQENQTPANGTDAEPSPTETLREQLDVVGVDVLEIEATNTGIEITIQTSGNTDTDINQVASAFSSVADRVEADISVHIEDRGLSVDRFAIEHAWAREHQRDAITDEEYLRRILETLEGE